MMRSYPLKSALTMPDWSRIVASENGKQRVYFLPPKNMPQKPLRDIYAVESFFKSQPPLRSIMVDQDNYFNFSPNVPSARGTSNKLSTVSSDTARSSQPVTATVDKPKSKVVSESVQLTGGRKRGRPRKIVKDIKSLKKPTTNKTRPGVVATSRQNSTGRFVGKTGKKKIARVELKSKSPATKSPETEVKPTTRSNVTPTIESGKVKTKLKIKTKKEPVVAMPESDTKASKLEKSLTDEIAEIQKMTRQAVKPVPKKPKESPKKSADTSISRKAKANKTPEEKKDKIVKQPEKQPKKESKKIKLEKVVESVSSSNFTHHKEDLSVVALNKSLKRGRPRKDPVMDPGKQPDSSDPEQRAPVVAKAPRKERAKQQPRRKKRTGIDLMNPQVELASDGSKNITVQLVNQSLTLRVVKGDQFQPFTHGNIVDVGPSVSDQSEDEATSSSTLESAFLMASRGNRISFLPSLVAGPSTESDSEKAKYLRQIVQNDLKRKYGYSMMARSSPQVATVQPMQRNIEMDAGHRVPTSEGPSEPVKLVGSVLQDHCYGKPYDEMAAARSVLKTHRGLKSPTPPTSRERHMSLRSQDSSIHQDMDADSSIECDLDSATASLLNRPNQFKNQVLEAAVSLNALQFDQSGSPLPDDSSVSTVTTFDAFSTLNGGTLMTTSTVAPIFSPSSTTQYHSARNLVEDKLPANIFEPDET